MKYQISSAFGSLTEAFPVKNEARLEIIALCAESAKPAWIPVCLHHRTNLVLRSVDHAIDVQLVLPYEFAKAKPNSRCWPSAAATFEVVKKKIRNGYSLNHTFSCTMH